MRLILIPIFCFLCYISGYGETRYEVHARKYAAKWAINVVHEALKAIKDGIPAYHGNIYVNDIIVDPLVKRRLYIEDMREKRKVFIILVIYQF